MPVTAPSRSKQIGRPRKAPSAEADSGNELSPDSNIDRAIRLARKARIRVDDRRSDGRVGEVWIRLIALSTPEERTLARELASLGFRWVTRLGFVSI